MIYTTYFANLKNLPESIVPVAICGKAPASWSGLEYKKLAPRRAFFLVWKHTHDNKYYIEHYNDEILNQLNANDVISELIELTNGASDIALVCYEKSKDFCHRHLVSKWLRSNGIKCEEFSTLLHNEVSGI